MRSIVVICIACSLLGLAHGQSLQFSRVLNLKGLHTGGWTQLDTVPAGKVWKIENYAVSSYNSLGTEVTPGVYLQWNQAGSGMQTMIAAPQGSSTVGSQSQPMWLAEGEGIWIARFTGGNGGYMLSILEFTVVP